MPTTAPQLESNPLAEKAHGKFLVFDLGSNAYALSAKNILEILQNVHTTKIPRMPDYVKGVMNLRGHIIALIDLRERFGIAHSQDNEFTCSVVVQAQLSDMSTLQIGLLVDAVASVINVDSISVEPTPDVGSNIDARFILGIAHEDTKIIRLLDVNALIEAHLKSIANL